MGIVLIDVWDFAVTDKVSNEQKEERKVEKEVEEKEDPLSSLDPFWASKKGN